MFFSNMKIGVKLAAAFAAIMLVTALTGGFAVKQLAAINANTEDIATNWLPSIKVLGQMRNEIANFRTLEYRHVLSLDDKEMDGLDKQLAESEKHIAAWQAKYEPLLTAGEETKTYEEFKKALAAFASTHTKLLVLSRGGEKMLDAAKQFLHNESEKRYEEVTAITTHLVEINDRGAEAAHKTAQNTYALSRGWLIGVLAAALVLATVLPIAITRLITGPLNSAVQMAQQVAAGDLTRTVQVRSGDEIGQLLTALNGMQQNLRDTVTSIKVSSNSVSSSAQEIAQANQDLSSRTEEQASALEETAASMEQMTATVSQNADNAKQANQLAASASATAVRGGQAVREVVGTMNGITTSSKKIADIIGVIDGIAFQTNILALNAAVEAARAGEQGRGFAVVASEVRSLAQRSAAAAKEIKELISDSVSKVDAGSRQVEAAGKTVDEIVASVKKVSDLVAEIAAASQEQAQGIEQVSETVTQLEKVTQQNAAMVEQASAAAASMEEQAGQLVQAVGTFKLDEHGQAQTQHSTPVQRAVPAQRMAQAHPKRTAAGADTALPKPHAAGHLAKLPSRAAGGAAKGGGKSEGWEEF